MADWCPTCRPYVRLEDGECPQCQAMAPVRGGRRGQEPAAEVHSGQCAYKHHPSGHTCPFPGNSFDTQARRWYCRRHSEEARRTDDDAIADFSGHVGPEAMEQLYPPGPAHDVVEYIAQHPELHRRDDETRTEYIARMRRDRPRLTGVRRMPAAS